MITINGSGIGGPVMTRAERIACLSLDLMSVCHNGIDDGNLDQVIYLTERLTKLIQPVKRLAKLKSYQLDQRVAAKIGATK